MYVKFEIGLSMLKLGLFYAWEYNIFPYIVHVKRIALSNSNSMEYNIFLFPIT